MSSYSSLLPALIDVLETSRKQDGLASKQALLTSTNEFKERLSRAKHEATTLPGGDMSTSDQTQIIDMLEKIRDYKRAQLVEFSRLAAYNRLGPEDASMHSNSSPQNE